MTRQSLWGVGILGIALLACRTASEGDGGSTPTTTASIPSPAGDSSPAAPRIHALGETATSPNYELLVERTKTCRRKGVTRPKKGNLWLGVEVTVESTGEREFLVNPRDARLVDSEGVTFNYTYVFKSSCEPRLENARLQLNEKATGLITFEVPETARGLVLIYDPILIKKPEPVRFQLDR